VTPDHLLIQWHITERCNLRCEHCYQEGRGERELAPEELAGVLEQCRVLLAELTVARGGRPVRGHVTLTGGEPFTHPALWEILEHIAAGEPVLSFAVLTNGTLLDRSAARRLRALRPDFVQVSIDGSEATHDGTRGRGSHARAVAGLRHLVREGVRTMISFTASRRNHREFLQVADLGRRLGVDRVWADRMVPCGGAAMLREDVLTPEETRRFIRSLHAARAQCVSSRTDIAMHRALQFTLGGGSPYRCSAGVSLLAILPGGDVVPCRRMPRWVGNIRTTPLAEIYRESPFLEALRERRRPIRGCEACFYSGVCAGGLRCLAMAVHGDPFRADPGCWLSRDPDEQRGVRGATGSGGWLDERPGVAPAEVRWKS
jgi:radical SAM protein with 4Fe4S-binding SPASM domain